MLAGFALAATVHREMPFDGAPTEVSAGLQQAHDALRGPRGPVRLRRLVAALRPTMDLEAPPTPRLAALFGKPSPHRLRVGYSPPQGLRRLLKAHVERRPPNPAELGAGRTLLAQAIAEDVLAEPEASVQVSPLAECSVAESAAVLSLARLPLDPLRPFERALLRSARLRRNSIDAPGFDPGSLGRAREGALGTELQELETLQWLA